MLDYNSFLREMNNLNIKKYGRIIILMGENHTTKDCMREYNKIIKRQTNLINSVRRKYLPRQLAFYSEAPNEVKQFIMEDTNMHSSVVIKDTIQKIGKEQVFLSSIKYSDREKYGNCNDKYAKDILKIFSLKSDVKCVIVSIGLLHVIDVLKQLKLLSPLVNIIAVNTCLNVQTIKLYNQMKKECPQKLSLVKPFFDLI